jgi:integrase
VVLSTAARCSFDTKCVYPIVVLMCACPMLALTTAGDAAPCSNIAVVRQSNWRGRLLDVKSQDSRRNLPIPGELVAMLRHYWQRRRHSDDGLLFPNLKGKPITSCYVRNDILHPVREKLGIERGAFHAFRHGHAS